MLSVFLRYYVFLMLCLLPVMQVFAQAITISEIRFVGNKVTRERILRQELIINPGDTITPSQLEQSRQSILDLGLFKTVLVNISETGAVVFTVVEKSYLLLLPRFSHDSDRNRITPGVKLTVNNIAGLNQRLNLTYTQDDAEDAEDGKQDELSVGFFYPKVAGTLYNLNTSVNIRHAPLQSFQAGVPVADYKKDEFSISLLISRWLQKTAPSSGWLAGLGMRIAIRDYHYVSGLDNAFTDDRAISMLGQISYTDIHDHIYSRSGVQYGYQLEQGLELLGSDYQFNRHLLYYRHFLRLKREHQNLNIQARLGFSDGPSSNLGEDAYAIEGYGDLRAYNREVSGDAFALLNLEYLRPILGRKHIRSLLFVDVGNAYASNSEIDFTDLKWAGGFGVRWKIRRFVDLDLSLEYAYDFDNQNDKVYFKTSGAF